MLDHYDLLLRYCNSLFQLTAGYGLRDLVRHGLCSELSYQHSISPPWTHLRRWL